MRWEKLGRILAPDRRLPWMSTYTGAAFALPHEGSSLIDLYVTGRDDRNRHEHCEQNSFHGSLHPDDLRGNSTRRWAGRQSVFTAPAWSQAARLSRLSGACTVVCL